MNIKSIVLVLFVLVFPVNVFAGDYFDVDYGLVLGSYHFTNSFDHSNEFNESNIGPTIYFGDKNNILPLIDEASVSYIHTNSFNDNSIYLFGYRNDLVKFKSISLDFGVGLATGYENHLEIAKKLGIMPFAGFRVRVKHFELGIIPTGLFGVEEKPVNVLTFAWRF